MMIASNGRPLRAIDVFALGVVALVLCGVVMPSLGHARRWSKIEQCRANLEGIGLSAKIYANENSEYWPVPAFSGFAVREGDGIDYLNNDGSTRLPNTDPGEVGWDRGSESTSGTFGDPDGGSQAVSTTRSFWILVRSGDVDLEHFICPSSHDVSDPTPNAFNADFLIEQAYDFTAYENISYGYHVPFGPRGSGPGEWLDSGVVVIADKGPYYTDKFEPTFRGPRGEPLAADGPHGQWRRYNSPNHQGQGQNCLFVDGSASFEATPLAGVHGDNIYTLMLNQWDGTFFNLIHGASPHFSPFPFPTPGQGAFGPGVGFPASTDSLIYP